MTPDQELMDCWVEHFGKLKPDATPKHWYDFIRKCNITMLYQAIDSIVADETRRHAPGLPDFKQHYWRLKRQADINSQTDGQSKFTYHNRCKGSGMLPVLEAGPGAGEAHPWQLGRPLPSNYYRSEGWIPCSCDKGQYINRYGLKGTGSTKGLRYTREFLDKFRAHFAHDAGGALQTWILENTIEEEKSDGTA